MSVWMLPRSISGMLPSATANGVPMPTKRLLPRVTSVAALMSTKIEPGGPSLTKVLWLTNRRRSGLVPPSPL